MSGKPKAVPSDILNLPHAAPNTINHELAPLKHQTWSAYNIFCFAQIFGRHFFEDADGRSNSVRAPSGFAERAEPK
jgi:hypothetical protein